MTDEPIEQFDPRMQALIGKPWFDKAVELIEEATNLLTEHEVSEGTILAGLGRFSLGDPLAGALVEVAALPPEGLAFVVLRVPDTGGFLDNTFALKALGAHVSAINPNGYVLALPAGWSFRVMDPEMARQFAVNMIAFVSDEELEKIGLRRVQPVG